MSEKSEKYYEIKVREAIVMPAISTEQGERRYSTLNFLNEWVVGARGMRRDEQTLEDLFEWEETIGAFVADMALRAGVTEPVLPKSEKAPEQPAVPADAKEAERVSREYSEALQAHLREAKRKNEAYADEMKAYREAIDREAVGKSLYVTERAFKTGKRCAKESLDEATDPAKRAVHPSYETKLFRQYHSLALSQAVNKNDIPKRPEPAAAAVPAPN